ncbi:TRAP transporter substrate-binding protein [Acuticoccus mangrovi]|uniref:TRAP transporter substrate-binding protein DctP n=1 Tax=Acuticoccus mangrovi TaxID=2796142 RepID=A0A934ISL3_9HYPH|nr:TRAP transporter substrate-binding protein DctP [Acuticoccus mangrovi]MBJ3778026.1 TRAP transporter substrate-binding protein DctP [Acuticoccus mangrovi]
MKLRTIAFACLTVFTAGGATAQEVVEGPKVTWNVSLWGNPRAFTQPAEDFKRLIAERTDGRFTWELFYGGQLSGPRENLDGLQIGAFEAAYYSSAFSPDKNPIAMGLDLPFLPIPDLPTREKVIETYFAQPAAAAEWDGLGVKRLYTVLVPQFEFMGVGEPPIELEDWNGKRIRALSGLADAMSALGASSSSISPPEVYTSLERGVIDAASFPFSYAHGAYGLHEVSDWYTANLNPGVNHAHIFVSKEAWAALPDQYKTLIEEVKQEVYALNMKAMDDADAKWIPIFKDAGLVAIEYTDEQRAPWIEKVARPVWDRWVEEQEAAGRPGKELLQVILETANGS